MVVAPGKRRRLGNCPQATPCLRRLDQERLNFHKEGEDKDYIYVTGGILEVQPHMVTILADSATHSDELDEEAALEAKNQAEKALKGAEKKKI
ncbi:MAG: hypothetical protein CM1200mP17_13040 [Woeseia sp.]|nr:MAG: hypothetical protein CM1200mP17_13040 [Woeseia sp.]